jgi:hypothetical protein
MRRLLMTMAAAVGAVAGGAIVAAGSADAHLDSNANVCAAARQTVENGAKDIVPRLREAATQMRQGDKAAADATVKAAGPKFGDVGAQLGRVAETASDPRLKTAVTNLGGEFNKVGTSLKDVNSLRDLDQSGIQTRGRELGAICGFSASPSPSGGPTSTT